MSAQNYRFMQSNLWEIDLFNMNGTLLFMRCVLRILMQTPIVGNSQRDEDTNNYDAKSLRLIKLLPAYDEYFH